MGPCDACLLKGGPRPTAGLLPPRFSLPAHFRPRALLFCRNTSPPQSAASYGWPSSVRMNVFHHMLRFGPSSSQCPWICAFFPPRAGTRSALPTSPFSGMLPPPGAHHVTAGMAAFPSIRPKASGTATNSIIPAASGRKGPCLLLPHPFAGNRHVRKKTTPATTVCSPAVPSHAGHIFAHVPPCNSTIA